MSQPAILIQHLSKSFRTSRGRAGDARAVLRDINVDVAPGSIVGLLGPNGAGKTTLLEILATLLTPTSGHAMVHGHDVATHAPDVRALIGYCPCGFDSFYARLTGSANLEFFAALHGYSLTEARRRLGVVFDLLEMNDGHREEFQKQSSGMKQKLALARALLADPPVLLLDEPTKSLDPRAQREVWQLLRTKLVGGLHKTIVLVTHSLVEAQEVCDRVFVLEDGRLVEAGRRVSTDVFSMPPIAAVCGV
jgi:ABC-2 type transport system ATP-binding protein